MYNTIFIYLSDLSSLPIVSPLESFFFLVFFSLRLSLLLLKNPEHIKFLNQITQKIQTIEHTIQRDEHNSIIKYNKKKT